MEEVYKKVEYKLTTHKLSLMPQDEMLEVAIVGRSNVGKSSLINLVSNQRNLAHISRKPGKTRGISFFEVENRFRLVDLPGYGFAKVSKTQKQMFGEMMEEYFLKRTNLSLVILLIDTRRTYSPDDIDMIKFLVANEITFKVIGTKADKVNQSQMHQFNEVSKEIIGVKPLTISVLKKKNIHLIRDYIEINETLLKKD